MDPNIKKVHNEIFVSDRIITYKIAAGILETDVNEAKKVLEKYVSHLETKNKIIHVSYIIGGITQEQNHKIKLVPLIKYEKTKALFKKITIDHIYSIQKTPLTDWSSIANLDDFLYDENDPSIEIKDAKPKIEQVEVKKEIESPQKVNNKKSALSNFFTNTQRKTENGKTNTVPKTNEPKKKIQDKKTAFTNFFSKNNKENVIKTNEVLQKEMKKESDDEDEIIVSKKRSRVITDDDDDDTPTKCAKSDILDDEEDVKEEYFSDEDLFGSPEKDEELIKDTESIEMETEAVLENCTETSEYHSETTEDNTEKSETIYEDDDGYFVTEKKKSGSIQKNIKKENQLSKKEIEDKIKVEKQETKSKKEAVQKIKNNTNQKTLFNFFQKK